MNGARLLVMTTLVALLVALTASAVSSHAAGTATSSRAPRIVFDCGEAYSILPDGSGLTPVVPRALRLTPLAGSRDGRTIVYTDLSSGGFYLSRANGAALRRFGRFWGGPVALSRNGKLLALPRRKPGIWIVRTNGHGLRRLSSGREDGVPDFSPDGRALVYLGGNEEQLVIVQPLHGARRVVARGSSPVARWSPDGRWIAYADNGLWLVRPDGAERHRLVPAVEEFAWAPDGRRLAVVARRGRGYRLGVVGSDGRSLRWLRLKASPAEAAPSWSPDGRRIAFHGGRRSSYSSELWVVGSSGRGLRRVASCGGEFLAWTRLAPTQPADPPIERVLGAETVATRDPVQDLSADGSRVAFVVSPSPTVCGHVDAWTPGASTIPRIATCGGGYDLELAGTRAAWTGIEGCGNSCDVSLYTSTLAHPRPLEICDLCGNFQLDGEPPFDFHAHGDGGLLVFDTFWGESQRLVAVGGGSERCQQGERSSPPICTTLRRGELASPVDSVSAGQIAVHEPDEVAVLNAQGSIVREFPFLPDEVTAARLDGGRLVVTRLAVIDVYDVATGNRVMSQPLPQGFKLGDVDGGIAVLRHGETIMLLRLDDGRSRILAPGKGPRLADLEPPGLYYSYRVGVEGRVAFIPRSELF